MLLVAACINCETTIFGICYKEGLCSLLIVYSNGTEILVYEVKSGFL